MGRGLPRTALTTGLLGAGLAAGAHVWARHIEINLFTLREVEAAVLPAGAAPLRLLHISDIHLVPDQARKRAFLRELADLEPDLVVDTGDNIASGTAIDPLLETLEPLLHIPGAFVMGSNDMYAPGPKNPLRYFLPDPRPADFTEERPEAQSLPTERLRSGLTAHGWQDLTNQRATTELPGLRIRWVGVDDPHLERDEMPAVAVEDPGPLPELRLGVAHAPYLRVLDAFVDDGCDLMLAGHTHGGQLRIPGIGALVTNCDLPRRAARGLSTWRGLPVHVSAGMGASPYSDYRFATFPEATLLTLRPEHP